jgi:predicted hydrocarbon binding protein
VIVHGIVFTSFRHFVTNRFGRERATRLWVDEPQYLITQAYADSVFTELFTKVCEDTGSDPDELLRDFGIFAAERTFVLLYPSYFDLAGDARTFLLTVETRIHELVRATVTDSDPPRLRVEPLEEDGVRILYDSPRRLCRFLDGLVRGTARHFEEDADVSEVECMLRGAPSCEFHVRLRPVAAPAA